MVILCLHTGIDLDKKKKARIWRLNVWRVKVRHLPATQLEFEPFPLHHLVSPPSCPFRSFSPPLSNSRRATGHDTAIVLNTVCESASYTVVPPHPHPLAGRQTRATQPPSPFKQLGSVFFFPFSNRRRTTAATSSRASQLLPPSRLASRTHLHLTCRSGEPFACTQATPLPPSCGTWPHLKTFR